MEPVKMGSKGMVIKFILGETTEAESLMVKQWMNENTGNKRYFDEIEYLWKASGIGREISEDAKNDDWNHILGKIEDLNESQLSRPEIQPSGAPEGFRVHSRELLNNFLKVAAIFLLAFSFSWATFYLLNKRSSSNSLAYNQIITNRGQKSQIVLSDGTHIWLNSESVLKYPSAFNKKQREVILEGEAFFEVAKKDNKIPFFVKTSNIDIEVLGTSFNVMAYADEETVETTVVEGSVNVVQKGTASSQGQNVILKPNQKVTLIKKGSHIVLSEMEIDKPSTVKQKIQPESTNTTSNEQLLISSKVDIDLHTAWKEDRLMFQSETFEKIALKLERWYDVKIHIQNEALKNYRYTGNFTHKETIDQVLEVLNLTTPIKYTFIQNDVYINIVAEK
jgi:ferric-dicitrate binding protein FerR (iron transport regulator)